MMTDAEYRAMAGINWSMLKHGQKSMAHLKDALDRGTEDKACYAKGRAVHCLSLTPKLFDSQYAVWWGADKRTKAGKDEWARFQDESAGKEIITLDDWSEAQRIANAVRSNDDAMAMLVDGEAEKPIVWTDDETGVQCKGRVDFIGEAGLVDLKTTKDASPRGFASASWRYGYHGQLAFYTDGLVTSGETVQEVHIIAVETSAPYVVQVYTLSPTLLRMGREEYRRLLSRYAHAVRTGEWPGYSASDLILDPPAWAISPALADAMLDESEDPAVADSSFPF